MARRSTVALHRGRYNPKVAQAARFRKRTGPRPETLERERELREQRARGAARRARIPKPNPRGQWRRWIPDTSEAAQLRHLAREENIESGGQSHEWEDELRAMALRHWRDEYNRQELERPTPRRVTEWIRVRAYRRHRPKHWRAKR